VTNLAALRTAAHRAAAKADQARRALVVGIVHELGAGVRQATVARESGYTRTRVQQFGDARGECPQCGAIVLPHLTTDEIERHYTCPLDGTEWTRDVLALPPKTAAKAINDPASKG